MIPRMRPGVLVASRAIRTTSGPVSLVSCRKHIGGTVRNQAPCCPVGADVADLDFAGATLGDVQLGAVGIDVDAVGILQPVDDLRYLTGGVDAIHRAAMAVLHRILRSGEVDGARGVEGDVVGGAFKRLTIAGVRHGIDLAARGDPGDAFAAGVGNVDVAVPVEGGPVGAFEFSEQPGLAVVIDPEEPSAQVSTK